MTALIAQAINPDRMIYFVLCQYKSGLSWAERDPANMSRRDTIADIMTGNLPDVVMVLECNPVEIICRDVTEDILAEAGVVDIDAPLTGQDAIDWQRDHARDQRKHERA
jgi:hypothetical protein